MAAKFIIVLLFVASAFVATTRAGVLGPVTFTSAAAPVVAKIANPAVDAIASTHENVVRSYDGTVSQYSKAIDTPYSSVRKEDTRISNNVYTPALAKTVGYAAPAPTVSTVYTHAVPSKTVYSSVPAATAAVYAEHHEPAAVYTTHHDAQAHHESYAAPVVHQPTTLYTHTAPAHTVTKSVAYTAPVAETDSAALDQAHVYHNYQHAPAVATATTTYNHGPDATTYSHNAPGVAAYGTSQTVHYSPANMVSHMSFDGFGTHWGF